MIPRLAGIDPDEDRLRIRALRAVPPRFAAHDSNRRRVFSAALGQFDELLTASATVGPASRPLSLYYALNQAGRAIAAALQQANRPWEPISHGLKIGTPDASFLGQTTITPAPRKKDGRDSFGILAEATNSDGLTAGATLSNVWAAIPNSPKPGLGAGCPRAIQIHVDPAASAIVSGTIHGIEDLAPTAGAKARVKAIIEDVYPQGRCGLSVDRVINDLPPYTGSKAELSWHHHSAAGPDRPVNQNLTQYLGREGGWWLIPRLNRTEATWPDGHVEQGGDVLPPLLLWWCLLHALSQIARYHSADWLAALDPDSSRVAVPIEQMLSAALVVVPRLVLLALSPGWIAL